MLQTWEQVYLIELIKLISNISFLADFNFDQNFCGEAGTTMIKPSFPHKGVHSHTKCGAKWLLAI